MNRMKMLVAVVGVAATGGAWATNYTCDVPEGETKSVSDFGYTFKDGDKLIKTAGVGTTGCRNLAIPGIGVDWRVVLSPTSGVWRRPRRRCGA